MKSQWENGRGVKERIVVDAKLVLDSPAHIGSGEGEGLTDMPLLLHETTHDPVLMGSSVAGALRAWLEDMGFESESSKIFGDLSGKSSYPSTLFIEDSFGKYPKEVEIEIRDGVVILPDSLTAADKAKFDMEILPAGTVFPLSFEFLVLEGDAYKDLTGCFALALKALENGEISIGKRKSRGFGRCHMQDIKIYRYDMSKPEGLIGWLEKNRDNVQGMDSLPSIEARTHFPGEFKLKASFAIDGSILIRDEYVGGNDPDSVHIHSYRNGQAWPVLTGTSLAGVLRARAYKIMNTIGGKVSLVDEMFGSPRTQTDEESRRASRLWVGESLIENSRELVQNRIKIDRFTGSSYSSALFNEQPEFGGTVEVNIALKKAKENEIGLLLLLLKDLWTSDLPVGGGAAIGRGRLKGVKAILNYNENEWSIEETENGLLLNGDSDILESFVSSLWEDIDNE